MTRSAAVPAGSWMTRANSSPPSLATVSPARTVSLSRSATATSRVSPAACPRVSLTVLKSSRSTRITLLTEPSARARRSRRLNSTRFGSWVSASWVALWSSRSSSRWLSRNAVICRSTTSAVIRTAPPATTGASRSPDHSVVISRASTAATAAYGRTLNDRRRSPVSAVAGTGGAVRCRSAAHAARKNTTGMQAWLTKRCECWSTTRASGPPMLPTSMAAASSCRAALSMKALLDSTTLTTANTASWAITTRKAEVTSRVWLPELSADRVWKCQMNTAVASMTVPASSATRSRSAPVCRASGSRYSAYISTRMATASMLSITGPVKSPGTSACRSTSPAW